LNGHSYRVFDVGDYLDETGTFATFIGVLDELLLAADSTGRRNTLVKSLGWCFEV